ncbi:unnamed protein product [Aphanomyces euteiches]
MGRPTLRCSVLLLCLIVWTTHAQNMYCGLRECYDILGLRGQETTATTAQIKKAYRSLSLQYHPDKNPSADAKIIFQELATAYEVLSSPLSRASYDHYLNNPDDHAYNYGMHVYHVYAPKSDYRIIAVGFVLFLSVVQYLAQSHRHKQALAYFRQSDEVKRKAKLIQADRSRTDEGKAKRASVKDKKQRKEQERAELEEIIDDLMANLEITGGYSKPRVANLLAVRIAVFPFTIAKYLAWQITWWYRYSVRGLPYSKEDVQYLTLKALGITEDYFLSEQFVEDREEVLRRELWVPENLEEYQKDLETRWKKKNPKKYKQMLASRNRSVVPDLEPDNSDYEYESD